jgi:CD109 antigen
LGNSSAELKLPKTFKPSESSTQLFEFQTGLGWTDGEYKLTVEGSGVSNFLETIPVKYVYKQFVILVQSDKAIYKPGQNVQFRILVLDFTLRPVFSKDVPDMKIFIMVNILKDL